jgi:hypothetical protein
MLTRSFKISLSIVYFQIMTTLGSIRKKKAGTGNWDEAWRDNGILSENWSGWRDFGTRYTGPSLIGINQELLMPLVSKLELD